MDSSETNLGLIDYVLQNGEDVDECMLAKLQEQASGSVYN